MPGFETVCRAKDIDVQDFIVKDMNGRSKCKQIDYSMIHCIEGRRICLNATIGKGRRVAIEKPPTKVTLDATRGRIRMAAKGRAET